MATGPRCAPPSSIASSNRSERRRTALESLAALPLRALVRRGRSYDWPAMYQQELILGLRDFWREARLPHRAAVHNSEGSAPGPTTPRCSFAGALGPEPWSVAYVEPSRRPTDGRYGDSPEPLAQQTHQFQVILKPSPLDIQDLYLESLLALGTGPDEHDVRFVEDDWESPTLGAWEPGLASLARRPRDLAVHLLSCRSVASIANTVSGESSAYGLERICMYLQNVESFWVMQWAPGIGYAELVKRGEREWCAYNFEYADTAAAYLRSSISCEKECKRLLSVGKELPRKARLARVRFRHQGRACVQCPRRSWGHRRHRAPALHRTGPGDGQRRSRGVAGAAGSHGLSTPRREASRGVAR